MGWHSYNMLCSKCGHEYKQDNGALSVYDDGHIKCPLCGESALIKKIDKLEHGEFVPN